MLLPSPTAIDAKSPRSTQFNQTEALAAIDTSPMILAPGAT